MMSTYCDFAIFMYCKGQVIHLNIHKAGVGHTLFIQYIYIYILITIHIHSYIRKRQKTYKEILLATCKIYTVKLQTIS